jgi:hypothetical protein
MTAIESIMSALEERNIARVVGIPHDEARMRFRIESNTVSTFNQFTEIIGNYYNYHFANCIAEGGSLPPHEARGRAKEILEREYRRRNGDIAAAFNDAHEGTNGGMRVILDTIADALKAESVERYMREIFDQYVAPNSWEDKLEIIRQFIARCGLELSTSIHKDQPERYAQNYRELIQAYVQGLRQTSSIFRRM